MIREVVDLPDFKDSAAWISQVLTPQISPREVADSLLLLKALGLIETVEGRMRPAEKTLMSDECVRSVKVLEYHRQMIQLGVDSMVRFGSSDREISGTTLRMNRGDVLIVKKLLKEFRKKILNLAANSTNADQIYQLNFQFFPLIIPNREGYSHKERGENDEV